MTSCRARSSLGVVIVGFFGAPVLSVLLAEPEYECYTAHFGFGLMLAILGRVTGQEAVLDVPTFT